MLFRGSILLNHHFLGYVAVLHDIETWSQVAHLTTRHVVEHTVCQHLNCFCAFNGCWIFLFSSIERKEDSTRASSLIGNLILVNVCSVGTQCNLRVNSENLVFCVAICSAYNIVVLSLRNILNTSWNYIIYIILFSLCNCYSWYYLGSTC